MDCDKFHMMLDVTLLLSTGWGERQLYNHRLNCSCMVLAYLNCCMCCDCHSFHRLGLSSNLPVICSRQLVVAIIPIYQIKWWPCTKVEERGDLPLGESTGSDGKVFQAKYVYIYLVFEVWGHYTCHPVHRSTYHYHYCWWMVKYFNIPWQ